MRVLVRHGHFAFYPTFAEDVARFCAFFDVLLERDGDFYTFAALKAAPRYSVAGMPWLGVPAVATYEGRTPWEVMRENDLVYSLSLERVVPKALILQLINPPRSRFYFIAESPLIQPGSINASGSQVLSYEGILDLDTKQLKVIEVSYE